jgi:hypothetical protein
MEKSLLERAKSVTKRKAMRVPSPQEIELALAWMKSEVSLTGVATALYGDKRNIKTLGGNALYRIAVCLREAYRVGAIKLE